MQRLGVLAPDGLVVAFSRDQATKVYVQHRIAQHGATLWHLLQVGGSVCVAGSADKMPSDVAVAFEGVAREHGHLDAAAAAKYVRILETGGRWQVEAWS